MMHTYEVSKLAQNDLDKIWKYSFENWSLKQADKYYESIVTEFQRICKFPEIGRRIEAVKPNHRIRQFQSHIIVYKISDGIIWIDRVLHKQMDIEINLNP